MGLRTEVVIIDDPAQPAVPATDKTSATPPRPAGRDHGKRFLITEMAAEPAEWWAIRLLMAASKAGLDLPGEAEAGMAGLAAAGLYALLMALLKADPATVKPLLDEMFLCVRYQHSPGDPTMDPGQFIEDVRTRFVLRRAVFRVHTGFSPAGDTPTTG